MEKFPKDVTNAEILVGGNPNILSDPMFIPEKKKNDEGRSKKSSKSDADISKYLLFSFIFLIIIIKKKIFLFSSKVAS